MVILFWISEPCSG